MECCTQRQPDQAVQLLPMLLGYKAPLLWVWSVAVGMTLLLALYQHRQCCHQCRDDRNGHGGSRDPDRPGRSLGPRWWRRGCCGRSVVLAMAIFRPVAVGQLGWLLPVCFMYSLEEGRPAQQHSKQYRQHVGAVGAVTASRAAATAAAIAAAAAAVALAAAVPAPAQLIGLKRNVTGAPSYQDPGGRHQRSLPRSSAGRAARILGHALQRQAGCQPTAQALGPHAGLGGAQARIDV